LSVVAETDRRGSLVKIRGLKQTKNLRIHTSSPGPAMFWSILNLWRIYM